MSQGLELKQRNFGAGQQAFKSFKLDMTHITSFRHVISIEHMVHTVSAVYEKKNFIWFS